MLAIDDPECLVCVTGASGFVGRLLTAALLSEARCSLVLPLRKQRDGAAVIAGIAEEMRATGAVFDAAVAQRVRTVELPDPDRIDALDDEFAAKRPDAIIHCAGCLDYFNSEELERVNVGLTCALLDRARAWNVRGFVYVSTAYSSGFIDGEVPENLHCDPLADPTEYTRTKRAAEHCVAASGLPFLILRPAIVIGDSRSGRYDGKAYGLYQLWFGIERLLCAQWEPEFHVVGTQAASILVHQDAFQAASLAAMRNLPTGSILNIASREDVSPNGRALWNLWLDSVFLPERVYYYDHPDLAPSGAMPRKQRALLALASTNLAIAAHRWRFATDNLDCLRAKGLAFPDATLESVWRCQQVFMRQSERVQAFMAVRERRARAAVIGSGGTDAEPDLLSKAVA